MFYHLAPLDCSTAAARAARRAVVGRLSLHTEDVRYVLVSQLSKKKAAAGRLAAMLWLYFEGAWLELARASESSCPVPASVRPLRLFARTSVQAGA